MKLRRLTSSCAVLAIAGSAIVAATTPTQAAVPDQPLGTRSLAQVLAADGHGFDHNPRDFDIADKFVTRVLAARPHSPLAIVTHGRQRVTAFLPTDGAFRRAATAIVGTRFRSERMVFRSLLKAGGIGGAESILLYHLVRGQTLTAKQARAAAPTALKTMQGGTVRIRVQHGRLMVLDRDKASPNAHVIPALSNINQGNRQIAHGISALLSPVGQ